MILLSTRRLLPVMALLSTLACAQAALAQSGYDPAAVGVRRPVSSSPNRVPTAAEQARAVDRLREEAEDERGQPLPPDSAQTLQNLLYSARDLADNRYQVDGQHQDRIEDLRREMEKATEFVWDHLTPQTQARYKEALDQANRLDALTKTEYRDVTAYRRRGGAQGIAREADATLRSMENALVPMLQEVRVKLEQQARGRRAR